MRDIGIERHWTISQSPELFCINSELTPDRVLNISNFATTVGTLCPKDLLSLVLKPYLSMFRVESSHLEFTDDSIKILDGERHFRWRPPDVQETRVDRA